MSNNRLFKSTLIVIFSIILSRLTGFIRETLVPNIMGVNYLGDSYNMAFKITGLMYDMLVGGAIAAALIPVLSVYISKKNEQEGWKPVGTFINSIIILMVIFCIVGSIFSKQVVMILAPGFTDIEQINLTATLVRILFPAIAFLMLTGFLNGVLNAHQRFVATAFGPSFYNLGCAVSIFIFGDSVENITLVAKGVVVTSFIYFVMQLILTFKNLKYYRPFMYLKHPDFKKIIYLAIPALAASSFIQVNLLITNGFASLYPEGVITAYNVADRTWQMPFGVFAQGIGIALLPSLSRAIANSDTKLYRSLLDKALKSVMLITIPCATGMIILSKPIVSTIFQFTDKFDEASIQITSVILVFFSIALVTQSLVTILNRAFYANSNTLTPFLTGIINLVLIFAMCTLFYKFEFLGVESLALAYSLTSTINAIILITLIKKKFQAINIHKLVNFIIKTSVVSLIMGTVIYSIRLVVMFENLNKTMQFVYLFSNVIIGLSIVVLLIFVLKFEERYYIKNIFKLAKARFRI